MLAIIPARGGSKGLPRKNLKSLNGEPLICHSIKSALLSKSIDRVIVSTDDKEIANISKECGAEVPFLRPISLAGDKSMVMDTYLHVIDELNKSENKSIGEFVALLPTVPLRLPSDIDKAVNIFKFNKADSVISVVRASIPIHWYRKISKEGILGDYLPEFNATKNRQDFEQTYIPNGAIYIFRSEVLRTTRKYYTDKTFPYIMPRDRSADIDNILDFEWAEYLFKKKQND